MEYHVRPRRPGHLGQGLPVVAVAVRGHDRADDHVLHLAEDPVGVVGGIDEQGLAVVDQDVAVVVHGPDGELAHLHLQAVGQRHGAADGGAAGLDMSVRGVHALVLPQQAATWHRPRSDQTGGGAVVGSGQPAGTGPWTDSSSVATLDSATLPSVDTTRRAST